MARGLHKNVRSFRIVARIVILRVWFNGRTSGCQSDDGGSIPPTRIVEGSRAKRLFFC